MEELTSPRTQHRGNPRQDNSRVEMNTPQRGFTVRRNPPRRARLPTPMTLPPVSPASSLPAVAPLQFLADDPPQPPNLPPPGKPSKTGAEYLRVFLRIRPEEINGRPIRNGDAGSKAPRGKSVWPRNEGKVQQKRKNRKNEICLIANDTQSVTLNPPVSMQETKRAKSEVYEGFSHVFSPESNQNDVYDKVMAPLVCDFLEGKSGLLAAMGPTGSGKTHTMFGTPREPGMVPLALQRLFTQNCLADSLHTVRSYYFSMFEICSERGKGEKIIDLTSGRTDVFLHHSRLKGLQEVLISSVTEAECLISQGMLRRATAPTNSNDQSSRSQCVINIRYAHDEGNKENSESDMAVLTIVDLAGAERERKTGNQGERLMESGFINNTFMIFGHCLRSLLEHQKNPKKPIQKHFLNSMLTRYLRDYLEGKKRLTLILTAKSTADDYLGTSFLLRQTLSYMKIKFLNREDASNKTRPKRSAASFTPSKQGKKQKCSDNDPIKADVDLAKSGADTVSQSETDSPNASNKIHCPSEEQYIEMKMLKRSNQIMHGLSRALWNVLQQYKQKLQSAEDEVKKVKEELKAKDIQVLTVAKELEKLTLKCSGDVGCMHSSISYLTNLNHNADGNSVSFVSSSPREDIQRQSDFVTSVMDSVVRLSPDDECCLPSPIWPLAALREEGKKCSVYYASSPAADNSRSHTCKDGTGSPFLELNSQNLDSVNNALILDDFSANAVDSSVSLEDVDSLTLPPVLQGALVATEEGEVSKSESTAELGHPDCNYGMFQPCKETNFSDKICAGIDENNLPLGKGISSKKVEQPVLELAVQTISVADHVDDCPLKSIYHKEKPTVSIARNGDKPRRRLRPASAVLLKEFSGLDVDVENVNPVAGAEKKLVEGRQTSKGNLSLAHILIGFRK